MKKVRSLFGFCFLMLSIGHAQVKIETISFESTNPFSLRDIIKDLDRQETQTVFGRLTLPIDSLKPDKKYPLIVGVAGSLGWRQHHLDYLKMYQEHGFATFELNSFKSRDVTSTVGSQVEVTIATVILDAYRALDVLANRPEIDSKNVAITGWSLGGGVTLFSGWQPILNKLGRSNRFAAHLAFYPPCFVNPQELGFTDAPMHILIGAADNWTPAASCQKLVDRLAANHTQIDITVFPEAHHGFDSETPVQQNNKGYSFKDCLFDLTNEGDVLMNYLGLPMSNPLLQKLGFLFCVERGVSIGGHPEARAKSFPFALAFMQETLQK